MPPPGMPAFTMSGLLKRVGPWLLWGVAVAAAWLNLFQFAILSNPGEAGQAARVSRVLYLASPLVTATVGVVIAGRRSANPVGWLVLVGGLGMAGDGLARSTYAWLASSGDLWPNGVVAAWVSNWAWAPGETALDLALLVFPTGRPPTRRWRPVCWGIAAAGVVITIEAALMPGPLNAAPDINNPLGPTGELGQALVASRLAIGLATALLLLIAASSVVVRFKRAMGEERQQLKWLAYAVGIGAYVYALNIPGLLGAWGDAATNLALSGVPLAVGIALLRYRLYDVDQLINRTLVYGVLSAFVAATYVVVVGYLGSVLRTGDTALGPSLLATGLIAVLFQPLRQRVQRAVNRLLYGDRDEPYAAISQLGRRLESTLAPETVLPTIVQAVRDALKLPYVAITLVDASGGRPIATSVSGTPTADPLILPLVYQRECLGDLSVGQRAKGEAFGAADRQLLEDLARQAGVAAHAVRLTAELQRSRERLVTAREEERRRLRRDLHDGFGPTLAALSLKLETARNKLGHEPVADALLADLATRAQAAVGDVRRLVYGLRPPALDELGLLAALRQQADHYQTPELEVHFDAPSELPPLPAAVEVAAYRIVSEGLTNVVRHAGAHCCIIRIAEAPSGLVVEVDDDGHGLSPDRPFGVGLVSMRERAEELGGTFCAQSKPTGGTMIRALLPLPNESMA